MEMETVTLLETVKSVPDVIWAAIIASILTLSGVLATNRGSYNRLIRQLSHDAKERNTERKMDIRRTVYLEAIEALMENYLILNKLSDLTNIDSDLSKDFSDTTAAISKVNIIGSDTTVKAVLDLSLAISKKYLELSAERLPLIQRRNEIAIQNNILTKSAAERDQMIQLMKNFNLQGSEDKRLRKVISDNYEFELKRCNEYMEKIKDLQKINNEEQIKLSLNCINASKEVSKLFVPAISAVRKEMGFPYDENAFREILDNGWKSSQESVSEFINKVTKKKG